jgi:hypothetical protein
MSSKSKKTAQETSRWIRVGVLSASALLPVLNTVINRIRSQQEAGLALAKQQNAKYTQYKEKLVTDTQSDVHDRLQSVGTTLADVLTELRARSNNQDLIRRTSDLREDLRDRGSKLSHAIAERSGEVSHAIAERSGEVSHAIAERSGEVSHAIAERSGEVSHVIAERSGEVSDQLVKRGRRAQQTIAEQDRSFWIAMGFGFGLTLTGIVTFVLVRRRLLHAVEVAEVDEPSIQLTYDTVTTQPETDVPASEADTPASELHGQIYAVHLPDGDVEALSNGTGKSGKPAVNDSVDEL